VISNTKKEQFMRSVDIYYTVPNKTYVNINNMKELLLKL